MSRHILIRGFGFAFLGTLSICTLAMGMNDRTQGRWLQRDAIDYNQRVLKNNPPVSARVPGSHPPLFRWHKADPSPYRMVQSNPANQSDPLGLKIYPCPAGANPPAPIPGCSCAEQKPPPRSNRAICDGKGNCAAWINNATILQGPDVLQCAIEHECVHCEQAWRNNPPTPCCKKAAGTLLGTTPEMIDADECEAYNASAGCLADRLEQLTEGSDAWKFVACRLCIDSCRLDRHCQGSDGFGDNQQLEMCKQDCLTRSECQ